MKKSKIKKLISAYIYMREVLGMCDSEEMNEFGHSDLDYFVNTNVDITRFKLGRFFENCIANDFERCFENISFEEIEEKYKNSKLFSKLVKLIRHPNVVVPTLPIYKYKNITWSVDNDLKLSDLEESILNNNVVVIYKIDCGIIKGNLDLINEYANNEHLRTILHTHEDKN